MVEEVSVSCEAEAKAGLAEAAVEVSYVVGEWEEVRAMAEAWEAAAKEAFEAIGGVKFA